MNFKSIAATIKNPSPTLVRYLNRYARFIPSDSAFLRIKFRLMTGHHLHLRHPRTFCEKLQWLKLYDRRPEYITMVDKYNAKKYVSSKIGKQYIVPLLGVWDKPEEINWENLPSKFVLKTTANAGSMGIVVVKDKDIEDKHAAIAKLSAAMSVDSYIITREWPYKGVKPRIIAEEYLEDESGELRDYKVMCFNGEPKHIQLHSGRLLGCHTQDIYDTLWNRMPELNQANCILSEIDVPRPSCLEEMLEKSKILAKGIPHVRIDWYVVNGKLFFGEITFYDASGMDEFLPYEKELEIGGWIQLPDKRK